MWTKLLRVILNLRFISRIYVSRYKGGLKEIYFSVTFTFFNKNVFLSYFTGSINKNDKQLFRRIKAQHSLFKSKSISNKKKPPPRPPHNPYLACWFFNQWLVKFSFWLSQIIGLFVRQNVLNVLVSLWLNMP